MWFFPLTYWLFRSVLLNFHIFIGFWIFFCYWVSISFHRDQRIFFVLLQPFYIYWDTVYPGDCFMYTWEEYIFLCRWMECSISARSSSYIALFYTNISLFIFCLAILSHIENGTLESLIITVQWSISLSTQFCFIYLRLWY